MLGSWIFSATGVKLAASVLVLATLGFLSWRCSTLTLERDLALDRAATAEIQIVGYRNSIAELEHAQADKTARNASTATIRKVIVDAPNSTACVNSAPVAGVLDGLRARSKAGQP